MPVYDFQCPDHGVFTGLVSYANSLSGLECPCCGAASPVLPALPQISTLSSALRRAENRAEATSCEPKVVKRSHLPSCGCNLCKKATPPTSRRWMLGQC
ncbi:hypothetical protein MU516_14080 [Paracoccus sp. YLB-12]|jgi:hypothetical protein|uniref:Putative regulatory protein FmdB zinc ribbon domain-containing protein n=1 Tax=Paracoccus maritimus TaxID=2933292 RepID=A0ABT2KBT7_9RHOB|nr:hypothetical protein [Paracoccus sp. YLB-12]MCT4333991.1 hypothetical protein [Paracoccus sp. YLB-12]